MQLWKIVVVMCITTNLLIAILTWTDAAGVWLTTAVAAVPLAVRAGKMAGVAVVVVADAAAAAVAVLFCCCRITKLGFVVGFEFPAAGAVDVVVDETTSRVCALMRILCPVVPAAAITCSIRFINYY